MIHAFLEEFNHLRGHSGPIVRRFSQPTFFHPLNQHNLQEEPTGAGLKRQPSFKWAQFAQPAKSPTKPDIVESPHPSPQRLEHDIPPHSRIGGPSQFPSASSSSEKPRPTPTPIPTPPTDSPNLGSATPKPQRQESSDNLKSFKVSLEDPTWKVLPAALKKYRINNDNWQNYAMFICYGSPGRNAVTRELPSFAHHVYRESDRTLSKL